MNAKVFPLNIEALSGSGSSVSLLAGDAAERAAGASPKRGTKQILEAYATMPWLRSVTKRVADSVADVHWRLFREVGGRRGAAASISRIHDPEQRRKSLSRSLHDAEVEQIDRHGLLDLLEHGNDIHDGRSARLITQVNYDLTGEGYLLIELDGVGMPSALWPIPASWVKERPSPTKPTYTVSPSSGGVEAKIPSELMVALVDYDPLNPLGRGVGTARSLADELETDEAAAKHVRQWFVNGARPDMLIFAEGLASGDTERLEQRWTEKLGGWVNRHRPFFLNRKLDVKTISQTFEQQQIVELRKFERDTVVEVFGVPPEIVGIIVNSNRATSQSADYHYARWVVLPRAELQRSAYQRSLVPLFERGGKDRLLLDFDSPVEEDRAFQSTVVAGSPYAFRINEVRKIAGVPPLTEEEGGELFPIGPLQGFLPEIPELEGLGAIGSEVIDLATNLPGGGDTRVPTAKALDLSAIDRILRALLPEALVEAVQPVVAETVEDFGEQMVHSIDPEIAFDVDDARVVDFIRQAGANRVTRINETTQGLLRNALTVGVREGEGIEKLASRINRVFDGAAKMRSRMIARTETVRASNFGNVTAMLQTQVSGKGWLSSRDADVRETHAPGTGLDGTVVQVSADFVSPSGARGPYPGALDSPAESIGCRCTLIAADLQADLSQLSETVKATLWKRADNRRARFELRMLRRLRRAFTRQRNDVIAALKENA